MTSSIRSASSTNSSGMKYKHMNGISINYANKQTNKQAHKQTSTQVNKQAGKQTKKQANNLHKHIQFINNTHETPSQKHGKHIQLIKLLPTPQKLASSSAF